MQVSFRRDRNGSFKARLHNKSFMIARESEPTDADEWKGEVMIVRALYSRDPETKYFDYARGPYGYLVRPVTEDDVLLEHTGFEISGSSCSTLSSAKYHGQFVSLSPGRMHGGDLFVTDNMAKSFYRDDRPKWPLIPGKCYVHAADLHNGGVVRLQGLPDYESTASGLYEFNEVVRKFHADMKQWDLDEVVRQATRVGLRKEREREIRERELKERGNA